MYNIVNIKYIIFLIPVLLNYSFILGKLIFIKHPTVFPGHEIYLFIVERLE